MTPPGQDDDENEQEAPDFSSSSNNNQSRTNVHHDDDDENNDAPTWFPTTTLFASLWELLELLGYIHDASVSSLDASDDDDANDRQEETPRTVTAEERQTTIRHNQGSTRISSLGNSTDLPAVEHDDDENDNDSSPTTTTTTATTIVVDPCPPKAPWRRAILTCLCTAPQKSSRHLTLVPAVSGLVLIVLPFAWTGHTSSSSSHWAKVVGGLQIALGVWSIGPTSMLLWWVPLTRPHEQRRHGVVPRDHVADALVYMHIGMPVFVLVMVVDLVLFALVLVSHALFLVHYESNAIHDEKDEDNKIHISLVAIPLLILRSIFLMACTVEPVIQTYHHFSTIPFYPFCLCYCCCPRWFRCCHRWWTRRGGNLCCCFGCCCGGRRKRRS